MTGILDNILNPDPNRVPSPKSLEAKRKIADALMMQGADASPVQHWSQGAARVANALIGGIEGGIYDRQERAGQRGARDQFDKIFGGGQPATDSGTWGAPAPAAAPSAAAPAPAPAPAGGAPPNPNNPGNLISGPNGFQSFGSPSEGVAALIRNVQSYPQKFNGGQPMTLPQIAARWAPKDDGSTPMLRGNNPDQWARNVATAGGLPLDQPLDLTDPKVQLAFARGVHIAEKGQAAAFAPDVYDQGLRMVGGGQPGAAPQRAAAPASPTMPPGTQTPFDMRAATAALGNPWMPEGQRSVLGAMIGQQIKPKDYGFTSVDGVIYRTDPRAGTVTQVAGSPTRGSRTLSSAEVQAAGFPAGAVVQVDGAGKFTVAHQGREDKWTAVQGKDGNTYMVNDRDPNQTRTIGGPAPPDVKDIDSLRKEAGANPAIASFRTVAPLHRSMQDAVKVDGRAADLNLVYGLATILDPGSVVRESDAIMVQRTGGLSDQVQGWINGLNGGATLTPQQRAQIMQIADSRVGQYRAGADKAITQFKDIATRRGWDTRDIEPMLLDTAPTDAGTISTQPRPTAGPQAPAAPPQQSAPTPKITDKAQYDRLPPGSPYVAPDGSRRVKQ